MIGDDNPSELTYTEFAWVWEPSIRSQIVNSDLVPGKQRGMYQAVKTSSTEPGRSLMPRSAALWLII